jgi:CRISPR/Cas system endoribonuclease Cas6 (RAMP superfamily)
MKKDKLKIVMVIGLIIIIAIMILLSKKQKNYNLEDKIEKYDLNVYQNKEKLIDYLKEGIKPVEIRKFIDSKYVSISVFNEDATIRDVLHLTNFIGYKMLFMSMFDKTRTNFDDCPVTEKFKEKFNTNLLEYFNLIASEDCESNCLLNREKQEITVEVYGNFENTEPTYQNTHHFHYTLDSDGNVDDVVFDYTEE